MSHAYRMKGERGRLIKTLFQGCARETWNVRSQRCMSRKASLLGPHIGTMFGLSNQRGLRVAWPNPFRSLHQLTTDYSCNCYNKVMFQHIVFNTLIPCDYFLHAYPEHTPR